MRVDPKRLPHWSRVAFAARCARRVQPLFAHAWPDAIPGRAGAVERAITLAEQSVAEERACVGVREALIDACSTAGRALIPFHYPVHLEDEEPGPVDGEASLVASFVAKVAEKAAEAAAASPRESDRPAHEAYHFALDAIGAANRPGLYEVLEADFEAAVARTRRPWWRVW